MFTLFVQNLTFSRRLCKILHFRGGFAKFDIFKAVVQNFVFSRLFCKILYFQGGFAKFDFFKAVACGKGRRAVW